MKSKKISKTNQEKQRFLIEESERLVASVFDNLEDNLKAISRDYQSVYTSIVSKILKEIEEATVNGEIISPNLLDNKLRVHIQEAVASLTLMDKNHDAYLNEILKDYYDSLVAHQVELINFAKENNIILTEVQEVAVNIATQFPYENYPFVTSLRKGTFYVGDKLNILLSAKLLDGKSTVKLANEIEEIFGTKKHIARRIARTETSRIINQANKTVYQRAGISKVKWLDSTEAIKGSTKAKTLVCSKCHEVATKNGGIYEINNLPPLPLHPHCRCTITPIVEDVDYSKFMK